MSDDGDTSVEIKKDGFKIHGKKTAEIIAILRGADEEDPKTLAPLLVKLGLPSDFLSRFSQTPAATTPAT